MYFLQDAAFCAVRDPGKKLMRCSRHHDYLIFFVVDVAAYAAAVVVVVVEILLANVCSTVHRYVS